MKNQQQGSKKADLRARIWQKITPYCASDKTPVNSIPNFINSEQAAERLTSLKAWSSATVVKCNPDKAQAAVRLRALEEGKQLYVPVPKLESQYPFMLLDPVVLQNRGIGMEQVIYVDGFMTHGTPVFLDDMRTIDFVVVGSVAASATGARIGKGGGFADLEMGIFLQSGLLKPDTPVATTIHSIQLVDDPLIEMEEHDFPLDFVATPDVLIETDRRYQRPTSIHWQKVRADQYDSMPFLTALRDDNIP